MTTYLVWCPDYGQRPEDGRQIKAFDSEDAAEIWAAIDDQESAEYSIVSGNEVTVSVRGEMGEPEQYKVIGEAVPSYRAVICTEV